MNRRKTPTRSAGFSMIEMLMTAFVLAIGILGLTMLQVLSLRAARGAKSLSAAVLLADRIMDQIEMEGRISWLNLTGTNRTAPSLGDLAGLRYITGTPPSETFNAAGGPVDTNSPDPTLNSAVYTVTTTRDLVSNIPTGTGRLSDFTVVVRFADGVDQANNPVFRRVTLARRILHG